MAHRRLERKIPAFLIADASYLVCNSIQTYSQSRPSKKINVKAEENGRLKDMPLVNQTFLLISSVVLIHDRGSERLGGGSQKFSWGEQFF